MDVMERIKGIVEGNPVVLFMKGTPQFPMCGFSMRAAKALKECGAKFVHVNVLEDPEVRAALPQYSNFPTFPQLYIQGELIGGCDITEELHASGELQKLLS
jgi:monothiol glutaredoxin